MLTNKTKQLSSPSPNVAAAVSLRVRPAPQPWKRSNTIQVQESLLQVREEARRRSLPLASERRPGGEEVAFEAVQFGSAEEIEQG